MISGSVSPSSIGLNDEQQIIKLIDLSRKLFIIVKYQCQFIVPLTAVFIYISLYIIFTSFTELLLYGISSTILMCLISMYFSNFLIYQYFYFYLVCKYLDSKLKNINEKLIQIEKGNCRLDITEILKTLCDRWFVEHILTYAENELLQVILVKANT